MEIKLNLTFLKALPDYLVQRYYGWKATTFANSKSWYHKLAEDGQHPRAMIISCCDSRVHVTSIFGSDAGEFFIHRNIANLVPPFKKDEDYHGTSAAIELKDKEITLFGDADFQLTQIDEVLLNKMAKRGVDVRFLDKGDVQKMGGDKVKQVLKVRNGIATEDSKKIQKALKESKLKVQASIQGDAVRVTGAKRDDLQAAMSLLRKDITEIPISFNNFRD